MNQPGQLSDFHFWPLKTRAFIWLIWLFPGFAFSQPVTNLWNVKLNTQPYNTHNLGDQIGFIGVNDDGNTELNIYNNSGSLQSSVVIPQVELLGSSLYNSIDSSFYVMGANEDITAMQIVKIKSNGAVLWQKNLPFNGYRFPYDIVKHGDQIAFTFAQLNLTGQSTGIGWWLYNDVGNLIAEKTVAIPVSSSLILPFASSFSPTGNLIMSTTNLESGVCKLYCLDPLSAVKKWEKTFNFPQFSTIESVYVDAVDDIFITGDNGNFARVNADGDILFQKNLGYANVSEGFKILENSGSIYVLGGWRESFFDTLYMARMLVGKYDKTDGNLQWIWEYNHTGNENGPIASDGYFKNDTTLIIQFTRLFESDWLGEFHLKATSGAKDLPAVSDLLVYPNPAPNGVIRIGGATAGTGHIRIFSNTGQLVLDKDHNKNELLTLPQSGAYIIEYQDDDGLHYGKVISEKK